MRRDGSALDFGTLPLTTLGGRDYHRHGRVRRTHSLWTFKLKVVANKPDAPLPVADGDRGRPQQPEGDVASRRTQQCHDHPAYDLEYKPDGTPDNWKDPHPRLRFPAMPHLPPPPPRATRSEGWPRRVRRAGECLECNRLVAESVRRTGSGSTGAGPGTPTLTLTVDPRWTRGARHDSGDGYEATVPPSAVAPRVLKVTLLLATKFLGLSRKTPPSSRPRPEPSSGRELASDTSTGTALPAQQGSKCQTECSRSISARTCRVKRRHI